MHKALHKCTNTHFELGWKEQIQMVQKPAFSGVPGINKNFHITQDSSPWDIFETFFSPKIFKHIQKEMNRYATQKINKKEQEGPLKPKSIFAQWNTVLLLEIKKFFSIIIPLERVMQVISVGLLEFVSNYSYPICSLYWNVLGIGSSGY